MAGLLGLLSMAADGEEEAPEDLGVPPQGSNGLGKKLLALDM